MGKGLQESNVLFDSFYLGHDQGSRKLVQIHLTQTHF